MARWVRRYWALPVVLAFVLAVAAISAFGRLGLHRVNVTPAVVVPSVVSASPTPVQLLTPVHGGTAPYWILIVFALLFVAATIALLIYLFLMYLNDRRAGARKRRFGGPFVEPTEEELARQREDVLAAVDAGIAELSSDDSDPRGAVIACWVRLEAVAAQAGVAQGPGATSSDLVAHLLASQRVSRDALTSLADLYRTARYSRHVIEETMRDQARDALNRLRAEIAGIDVAAT